MWEAEIVIFFVTSIRNNEDYVLVDKRILINTIKFDIIWKPGESSLFKLLKVGNTSFKQLLVFTIELLIFDYYLVL